MNGHPNKRMYDKTSSAAVVDGADDAAPAEVLLTVSAVNNICCCYRRRRFPIAGCVLLVKIKRGVPRSLSLSAAEFRSLFREGTGVHLESPTPLFSGDAPGTAKKK